MTREEVVKHINSAHEDLRDAHEYGVNNELSYLSAIAKALVAIAGILHDETKMGGAFDGQAKYR